MRSRTGGARPGRAARLAAPRPPIASQRVDDRRARDDAHPAGTRRTGLGAAPHYEEYAAPLYAEAARAALTEASAEDGDWRRLSRISTTTEEGGVARDPSEALVVPSCVAEICRYAPMAASARARPLGEHGRKIGEAASLFPSALLPALIDRERDAAAYLAQSADTAELARCLADCAAHGGLPPVSIAAQSGWQSLVAWLLVGNEPQFRAKATAKGFSLLTTGGAKPSGGGAKLRWKTSCALAAVPQLADALHAVRLLPPARYADDAWAIVEGLLAVLPRPPRSCSGRSAKRARSTSHKEPLARLPRSATTTRRPSCC